MWQRTRSRYLGLKSKEISHVFLAELLLKGLLIQQTDGKEKLLKVVGALKEKRSCQKN